MATARGRFISFEGADGVGKSTQIRELRRRLASRRIEVLTTREPGGTVVGEQIRTLLQHPDDSGGICPETELLLFTASRAQLVREVLVPALERGVWVLADRFHDSTTVYQGLARALDPAIVDSVNLFAVGNCIPDLTILLDLDVAEAKKRLLERREPEGDRMENEPPAFFEEVRRGYLALARREPQRFLVLDASR
jgi:dTMP kinase